MYAYVLYRIFISFEWLGVKCEYPITSVWIGLTRHNEDNASKNIQLIMIDMIDEWEMQCLLHV